MGNRLDISVKDLTDDQRDYFITLTTIHGSKSEALKHLIDTCMNMNNEKKGMMRNSTHEKIHEVVTRQMAINANTDKVISIGTINPVEVKYEQRAITPKWIQENARATQQACLEYIAKHQAEIDKHHQDVLGLSDPEIIKNFNRRTGKASVKSTGKASVKIK